MISAEVVIKAQMYDLDPMGVVWHGNYARFLEEARCELLERISFNYLQMQASGYLWPIVDMRLKYVRPIRFGQEVVVTATVIEWRNRLKIEYRIHDQASGEILTKAHTVQVAVVAATGELLLESPPALTEKIAGLG